MQTKKDAVFVIGGYDPSSGAGLLADKEIFAHYHIPAVFLQTANTLQNNHNYVGHNVVPAKFVMKQMHVLLEEYQPKIIKIGMLGSTQHIPWILKLIEDEKPKEVVWDPILQSSSGGELIDVKKFNRDLLILLQATTVFTPNIPEAKWILGNSSSPNIQVDHKQLCEGMAKLYQGKGRFRIILKGGHSPAWAIDYLYQGGNYWDFREKKYPGKFRGTGCRFASILAAQLFLNKSIIQAIPIAKEYLRQFVFNG